MVALFSAIRLNRCSRIFDQKCPKLTHMKNQEKIASRGKRPRIRHNQNEEVIADQRTNVEEARLHREAVMHNQVDEPSSPGKHNEK